jgi:hypothetical protein
MQKNPRLWARVFLLPFLNIGKGEKMRTLNEWRESQLDGTQGYDQPISAIGQQVIQMCQHYFQTLSDDQIQQIGQMIQQFAVQNRDQGAQQGAQQQQPLPA